MYLCGPTVYNYVHIGNALGIERRERLGAARQAVVERNRHGRKIRDEGVELGQGNLAEDLNKM
jgi:hypothetical protein